MSTHFKGTTDPYPIKLEMTVWGATQIQAAILTVRDLYPNSELSVILGWLKAELSGVGINAAAKLDSSTACKTLSPL